MITKDEIIIEVYLSLELCCPEAETVVDEIIYFFLFTIT
jgi:hypothetical protein